MTENYREVLNFGFKFFNYAGFNPLRKQSSLLLSTCVASYALMMLNTIFTYFLLPEVSFEKFCKITYGLGTLIYLGVRMLTMMIKKEDFVDFMTGVNQFWPVSDHHDGAALKNECHTILKWLKIFASVYFYLIIVNAIIFSIMALCFGSPLIFEVYVPKFLPWSWYVVWYYGAWCSIGTLTAAFDSIYVSCVITLLIQIKLLNKRLNDYFASGKAPENNIQLKMYVDHHNFILRQIRKLGEIYGPLLLTLIWTSMVVLCLSLYSYLSPLDASNHDRASFMFNSLMLIALVTSFFITYFIPSQMLSNEVEKLSQSLYSSKWFEASASNKQNFQIILMNSQQEVVIKAIKLVPMNHRVALDITRTVFSFFAFLKTMQDKLVE